MASRSGPTRRYFASSPFRADPEAAPAEIYAVDDLVSHDKHGVGKVLSTESDTFVVVRFGEDAVRVPNDRRLCKL